MLVFKYYSNYDFKIAEDEKLICNESGKSVEFFWDFNFDSCLKETKEDVDIK